MERLFWPLLPHKKPLTEVTYALIPPAKDEQSFELAFSPVVKKHRGDF
jgi:hypothetical protein